MKSQSLKRGSSAKLGNWIEGKMIWAIYSFLYTNQALCSMRANSPCFVHCCFPLNTVYQSRAYWSKCSTKKEMSKPTKTVSYPSQSSEIEKMWKVTAFHGRTRLLTGTPANNSFRYYTGMQRISTTVSEETFQVCS